MAAKMIGFIFLLGVVGSLAGPIAWNEGSSTCAEECPESKKFQYQPNTVYEYTYESDVQTSIPGSTEEQSSLHMRATVQVEALAPCEMNMKLLDVSLQDSNPAQYESRQHVDEAFAFKRQLQEKGLRFGYVDGRIDHICPEEEPAWVLNIKRGVLSSLQNTQSTLDAATKTKEVDISGECPVEYSMTGKGWSVKKIKKIKDMLGCSDRLGHRSAFAGSPYEIDTSIKSMPLLKSTHECDQEINSNGILTQSLCKELHIFRPFSDEKGGAQTEVTTKLTFVKEKRGVQTPTERVRSRGSLLFDHSLTRDEVDSKFQEAQQIMRELCQKSKDDIRPEVPGLFTDLVREMRSLDDASLLKLHSNADGMCENAKKFFRDAIPNIGTASSLTMIRSLIQQGRVEEDEAALWLTHLAFVPQPSRSMLAAVKPLLSSSGAILRKAALAVSSMVHNYCKMNADCSAQPEVQSIIKMFEDKLNYNCKSRNVDEHENIIMALKAIGNTGNAESAIPILMRCIQNAEETIEMRVAAISALRRMPCSAERTELMSLFGDKEADSELRINAYLMVMQCPTEDIVHQIKELLNKEEINQVGSFVWTHLTNIMESSDPNKRELRELLQTIDLKVFDKDMRKYSKNLEWSMFSDMINAGAKVESNIIFSPDSFLPRSGMVNLTVDMFGHSVNLIEVGGRTEGLDEILEGIFNPQDNNIRQKRDVINPGLLERLARQFNIPESKGPQESLYMKIFGNEIMYTHFHDIDLDALKDKVNYLDWLIKLSQEQQMDYTKTFMFLDSTLNVPTAAGLPLKLSVDGTATVNVQLNGKMDVRQMFSSPSTVDIDGSIKPSAAVEICSEMSVDAFVARTGLKMVSTMHSSTVTQGKISLLDGKVFHFDLEMPKDKQEIFNTESNFFVMYRDEERPQKMIGQGRTLESHCYDLESELGIEICGEVSIPMLHKQGVARFPFTGPASSSFYINKKDTFTKYHIEGAVGNDKRPDVTEFKLNINTPGSKIDREIDAFFNFDPAQKTVNLNLKTPWKKANMKGEVTNTKSLRRISAQALIDDKEEYNFITQVEIDSKKFGTNYTPLVQIDIHGKPSKTVKGTIFYRDNKKFEIDLKLEEFFKDPVVIDGSITKVNNARRMKYESEVNINSNVFKGKLDALIDSVGDTTTSRVVFSYKNAKNKQERVTLSNKIRDQSAKGTTSYSIKSALTTTFLPKYNGDFNLDFTFGKDSLSAALDTGFDDTRRVKFNTNGNFVMQKKDTSIDGMARLEAPFKGIEHELSFGHKHTTKDIKSHMKIVYGGKTAEAVLDATRESTKPIKAKAKISLMYPGREMSLSHEIEEKKPSEYHNAIEAQLDKYTKATANGVYILAPRHEITATINLPQLSPIRVEGHLKPDLFDIEAHGAVDYNSARYYTTASWNIPKNIYRNFESRHSILFGCPHRSMEMVGKSSYRGRNLLIENDFKWDSARSQDKKVTTTISATLIPTRPKANIRAEWYPNRFVQIEADGKYETDGWYRTTNDLEGSVKFTSSFPYLQNINANLKHDYGHDEIKTVGAVSWGPGQRISTDFKFNKNTWNDASSSVTLITPFRGYRTMKIAGNYKLGANSLDSQATFQREQMEVKLAAKGSANLPRHQIEGELSFTSPFPGYQSLKLTGKHEDNGRNFDSNVDFAWGPGRNVNAKLTMAYARNGYSIDNNGALTVTTPFRSYQKNKLTWTHMNKDGSLSTRVDTDMDGVTSMISIGGNFDTNSRKTSLNGDFMLDTPFASAIHTKISHIHGRKGIESTAMVQWAPGKVIEYIHNIRVEAWESMELAAKVTTPFPKYDTFTLESITTKKGIEVDTKNEFKWSKNQKINIDGTISVNGPSVAGQLRVSTPFNQYQRTVLNVINKNENDVWMQHGDIDIRNKKYEIDTSVGWNTVKKLSIDTTKLHEYGFLADAEFSGEARDFITKGSVNIPALFGDNPYSAVVESKTGNLRNIKALVSVTTPQYSQVFKAAVSHKVPSRNSYISDATLEVMGYKGSASNTMNLNSWTNFDTKSIIEYQNKKIELNSQLQNRGKLQGSASFKSPYTEPITFIVNHEGSPQSFKSSAELTYLDSKKISGNVDFELQGTSLKSNIRILSPYTERISASVNHNGAWRNFENNAVIEVIGKRTAAESKFTYAGSKVETSATLELPLRKVRTIKGEYKHEGPLNNFKCESKLTVDNKEGTAMLEFKNNKVMSGKFELVTPFNAVRTFNAEFTHDAKKWNSFKNEGEITWNNKKYSGDSELRWFGKLLKVNANLKIPQDSYALKIKHKGGMDDFNNNLDIDLSSGLKYAAESSYRKTKDNIEGQFKITTPHEKFRAMSGDFKISGNKRTMQASATLNTPFDGYNRFHGELTHNGQPNRFTTTAMIETPFEKLPSTKLTIDHSGNLNAFSTTTSSEYNGKTVTAKVDFKNSGKTVEGSASLVTPYRKYRKFEGKFNHVGTLRNFKTSAEIETPFTGHTRYSANLEHNGSSLENFKTMGQVTTPYSGYERSAFMINHNGDISGMSTDATVETSLPGYDKFGLNINHNGDPRNVRSMIQLTTPVTGYDNFGINVHHKEETGQFQSGADITTPWKHYNVGGSLKHTGDWNNFNSEATLKLPLRNYQDWGIKITHSGNLNDFRCSATLTMPCETLPSIKGSINHKGNLQSFENGFSVEYNNKKIESDATWQHATSRYERSFGGSYKLTTPYKIMEILEISGNHNRKQELKTGKLVINHNQREKVNLDYSYTTGARKNIRVTIKEPKMFEALINFDGTGPNFNSDASFNWERKTNINIELNIKNQISGQDVDRQITFKTSYPRRELGFDVIYKKNAQTVSQSTEIQWDRSEQSKMKYELEYTTGDYRRPTYDGSFKFISSPLNFETTFNHISVPGRQMTTEVKITMDETLKIKHDMTFRDAGVTSMLFTVSHPQFSRDALLKIDSTIRGKYLEGEIDLKFEREALNFKGKLSDEGVSSNMKYITAAHLTYPNMRLDVKFDGDVYNSRRSLGGNMDINYLTSRNGMKKVNSEFTYDKETRTAKAEINVPLHKITISGSETYHDDYNGIHRFDVSADLDGKTVKTEFGVDVSGRKVEAKLYSPDNNMLHLYARYNRPSAEMKMYRQMASGQEIQDVLLSLNLDSDKLISGQAYVRPDLWSDIKSYEVDTRYMKRDINNIRQALSEELRSKKMEWDRVSTSPRKAYESVKNDLYGVYRRIERPVKMAYRDNEFYMKDIMETMSDAYDAIEKMTIETQNQLSRAMYPIKKSLNELKQKYDQYEATMKIKLDEFSEKMQDHYAKASKKMKELYKTYKPHFDRAVEKVRAAYKTAKDAVVGAYNKVRYHPNVQKVVETLQSFQPSDVFAPLRKLKYKMSQYYQKVREDHSTAFQVLDEAWDNIVQRQEIRDLGLFFENAGKKIASVWQKYDVQKNVKIWLKNLSKANWRSLKNQLMNSAKDYFKVDKTRWTTYDPQNGNYEFELYIPYDLKELDKLPKIDVKYYIRQAQQVLDDLTMDEDWTIWDTIYKYKPSLNYKDWVPPFKAHATIAGNQHFITFDKMFYEFAGECSYLLARDFINGRFSVIVNYESKYGDVSKKSITVFSNNKQVEVFPTGRVLLDGRNAEMPLEVEGTTIKRKGNKILIDSKSGINIDCDLPHDRCTVAVSGWYFGKTAGLMGTYDNEPVTDLMRADNRLANSVEEMVESWTVGSRCRQTNFAKVSNESPTSKKYQMCASYFKEKVSVFRPCFMQVDPQRFMTMCLNESPMETDDDLCKVASYYVNECKMAGVNVRLPRTCVSCDIPNVGRFVEGENITLTESEVPKSADVVFVIQKAACNKDVITKMDAIVKYFDKTFRAAGMDNILYGLVGFDGMGEPDSHTMEGQLMASSDKLIASINNMNFEGSDEADVMSATRYASLYPFRAGVSKSIIVLPCDSCREGATRYTELQRLLIERDIRLHMFMDHQFTLRGTKSVSPKTGLMFGIDQYGLFNDKHVSDNELKGDAELKRQVSKPKDLCAALSEVSDGSVFSKSMMMSQRSSMQKTFIDVMVRLMVKKAKPSECQMCDCVSDNVGVGMTVCHHCEMNPIYNLFQLLPNFDEEYDYDYEDDQEDSQESQEDEDSMEEIEVEEPKRTNRKFGRRNRGRKNQER